MLQGSTLLLTVQNFAATAFTALQGLAAWHQEPVFVKAWMSASAKAWPHCCSGILAAARVEAAAPKSCLRHDRPCLTSTWWRLLHTRGLPTCARRPLSLLPPLLQG